MTPFAAPGFPRRLGGVSAAPRTVAHPLTQRHCDGGWCSKTDVGDPDKEVRTPYEVELPPLFLETVLVYPSCRPLSFSVLQPDEVENMEKRNLANVIFSVSRLEPLWMRRHPLSTGLRQMVVPDHHVRSKCVPLLNHRDRYHSVG